MKGKAPVVWQGGSVGEPVTIPCSSAPRPVGYGPIHPEYLAKARAGSGGLVLHKFGDMCIDWSVVWIAEGLVQMFSLVLALLAVAASPSWGGGWILSGDLKRQYLSPPTHPHFGVRHLRKSVSHHLLTAEIIEHKL